MIEVKKYCFIFLVEIYVYTCYNGMRKHDDIFIIQKQINTNKTLILTKNYHGYENF